MYVCLHLVGGKMIWYDEDADGLLFTLNITFHLFSFYYMKSFEETSDERLEKKICLIFLFPNKIFILFYFSSDMNIF